ncbi:uncharacterized protein LOC135386022 isoform X2 [Ornithodoros turicata]|uniref:uncharacterized protein LOC135386022 isoform X2 n=1 Tax=Ornithodoros turicata TaxID=34597 RepID=UPI0031397B82
MSCPQLTEEDITPKAAPLSRPKPYNIFQYLEVFARFEHYRSESYAQAIHLMASQTSLRSDSRQSYSSCATTLKAFSLSQSAPSSPKGVHNIDKSSTLPSTSSREISFPSPKKSSSLSLSSFFKKFSPRFKKHSKSKSKPWIVVEFSQKDIDGSVAGRESMDGSDQSLELALQGKEQYMASLEDHRVAGAVKCRGGSQPALNTLSIRTAKTGMFAPAQQLPPRPTSACFGLPRKSVPVTKSDLDFREWALLQKLSPSQSKGPRSARFASAFRCALRHNVEAHVSNAASGTAKAVDGKRESSYQTRNDTSHQQSSLPHSVSADTSTLVVPETSRRVQPPQTLSLQHRIVVHSPPMDPLGMKVPSTESIGACSLDVEASDSQNRDWNRLTKDVSEMTLRSVAVSGGSSRNMSPHGHGTPDGSAVQLSNGYLKVGGSTVERLSSTTMEHRPSYLGISCAVNGYTSYSQFCRSRDPSPAPRTTQKPSPLHMERIRLQKDEVTANGKCSNGTKEAQPSRSLVQQRIATLYGAEAAERVARSRTRTSARPAAVDSAVGKRSLSCSAQPLRGRSRSPPVFKHLTKNFREHLRLTEVSASPVESLPGYVEQSTKASKLFNVEEKTPPASSESRGISYNSGDLAFVQGEDVPDLCVQKSARMNGCTEASALSDNASTQSSLGQALPLVNVSTKALHTPSVEKEGYAFLKILEDTQSGLEERIKIAKLDLAQQGLSEDARGHILSAVGKGNLLISQKMQHFRELCLKNIEQDGSDPFQTTGADLAGFWDMVMLQVDQVHGIFDNLSALKQNNWVEPVNVEVPGVKIPSKFTKKMGSRSVPASPKHSAKADSVAKARAEARKKLMEAKRMAAKQVDRSGEGDIAIYMPQKREDS